MSFKSYPRYKYSGTTWIGELPENWTVKRFKQVFRERDERSLAGEETLLSVSAYTGVSPRSNFIDSGEHLTRAESLEGYKICYQGDLVMNIMLAWNRGLGISAYDGIVSPAYCVFSVIDGSCTEFLDYLVRSDDYTHYFKCFSAGVIDSRLRLYSDAFGRLFCGLPPRSEQRAIARFLKRETSRIDSLIAEQARLIELLKEKRQAVISRVVTKGLDTDSAMKASGVDWLESIPTRWSVRRVKQLCGLTTSGPRGWSDRLGEEGAYFVQSGDLTSSLSIDFENANRVVVADDPEMKRTRLRVGDVLVCITGAKTGKVAVCTTLPGEAYINQHLCLVRPTCEVHPKFLALSLASIAGQTHMLLSQYGLKQGLSLEDVRETPVPLPPLNEQLAIIEAIDEASRRLDELHAVAEESIDLLQERRRALISSAVTGKIDVRSRVDAAVDAA
jgi:type I restriction enzyme S subunit